MTATLRRSEDLAESGSELRLIWALARFEAKRTAKHPLTWLGVVGSLWMMWGWIGTVAPILSRDSIYMTGSLIPLAASASLVAFYATIRERGLPELVAGAPMNRNLRTLGLHGAVIGPVLLSVGILLVGLVYLLVGAPVGMLSWLELLAGPIMVAAMWATGVFLGRLAPHPVVAPIGLLVVGFLQLVANPDATMTSGVPTANFEWVAPWMTPSVFVPIEELAFRPALYHLLFLLGTGIVALLWSLRGVRVLPIQLGASAVLAVGILYVSSSVLPPHNASPGVNWQELAATQPCRTENGIEYCYFPMYEGWVDRWQSTVTAVDALRPVNLDKVVQRPEHTSWSPDEAITDPLRGTIVRQAWDRPGRRPDNAFRLALLAAGTAVNLPAVTQTRQFSEEEIAQMVADDPEREDLADVLRQTEVDSSCVASGQARAAVTVWLAASSLQDGAETLRASLESSGPGDVFWPGLLFDSDLPPVALGWEEAELAQAMLELPRDEVQRTLDEHWDEILDPSTSSVELATWLGLAAPQIPELDSRTLQEMPRCV